MAETSQDIVFRCEKCKFATEFMEVMVNHKCRKPTNTTTFTREPVGPLSELVPERYHRYLGTNILKSYLASNQLDANKFMNAADPADIPIITKKRSDTVYQHVMDNLTEDGQDAVKDISPWIFNTLVDWAPDFEKFFCSQPLTDTCTIHAITCSKSIKSRESITAKQPEELDGSQPGCSKLWKTSDVKKLIDLHIENEHKFNKQSCKKKVIWQEITDEINNMGNNFNYQQVEQKWKNLTKSFRATVDHNNKSGNDKMDCPFFKELEEAYGYKANVKPIFTLGSFTRDNNLGSDSESMAESDGLGNSENNASPQTKCKQTLFFVDFRGYSTKTSKKEHVMLLP